MRMNAWLIGPRNSLARAFTRGCTARSVLCKTIGEDGLDAASPEPVDAALRQARPNFVIYLGAPHSAEESDAVTCWQRRCVRPVRLAEACARNSIHLMVFSSAHVFDGRACEPYLESAPTAPTSTRGRAEAAAEAAVLQAHPGALVIRTTATLDPWNPADLVSAALTSATRGETVSVEDEHVTSPTYIPDLVNAALDLAASGETGVWHVANRGAASWFDVARTACVLAALDPALVQARSSGRSATSRRACTALRSGRGCRLPTLEDALSRYIRARAAQTTHT